MEPDNATTTTPLGFLHSQPTVRFDAGVTPSSPVASCFAADSLPSPLCAFVCFLFVCFFGSPLFVALNCVQRATGTVVVHPRLNFDSSLRQPTNQPGNQPTLRRFVAAAAPLVFRAARDPDGSCVGVGSTERHNSIASHNDRGTSQQLSVSRRHGPPATRLRHSQTPLRRTQSIVPSHHTASNTRARTRDVGQQSPGRAWPDEPVAGKT